MEKSSNITEGSAVGPLRMREMGELSRVDSVSGLSGVDVELRMTSLQEPVTPARQF
jgi:hypothetical protein